jgi:hypothetical protein
MRSLTKRRCPELVAVVGLLALGLAPAGCGHSPPQRGGVDLIVTVPAGVAVEVLTFALTGEGFGGLAGGIAVSAPQQEFEKLINYVPAGDDDELDVSAKSIDARIICKGSTRVSVRQGTITRVHVGLACNAVDGNVVVNVTVANADGTCPGIPQVDYMVSPLTAPVGDAIVVTATTHAADAGALSYDWSAPSGKFANPSSSKTTYRCEAEGFVTLSLRVMASNCVEQQSITVDCLGPAMDAGTD